LRQTNLSFSFLSAILGWREYLLGRLSHGENSEEGDPKDSKESRSKTGSESGYGGRKPAAPPYTAKTAKEITATFPDSMG